MIGLLGTAWWAVSAVLSTLGMGLEFGWDGAVLAWDVGRISFAISEEVFEGVAGFV